MHLSNQLMHDTCCSPDVATAAGTVEEPRKSFSLAGAALWQAHLGFYEARPRLGLPAPATVTVELRSPSTTISPPSSSSTNNFVCWLAICRLLAGPLIQHAAGGGSRARPTTSSCRRKEGEPISAASPSPVRVLLPQPATCYSRTSSLSLSLSFRV